MANRTYDSVDHTALHTGTYQITFIRSAKAVSTAPLNIFGMLLSKLTQKICNFYGVKLLKPLRAHESVLATNSLS